MTDQLADDRYFRVLAVVDQFRRECVALHGSISIRAQHVGEVFDQVIRERSASAAIPFDNGSELTSRYFDSWAYSWQIDLDFIRPARPVENAFIESFSGRLLDDFPSSQDRIVDRDDAQAALAAWQEDYNVSYPHTSPGSWRGPSSRWQLDPRNSRFAWSNLWGVPHMNRSLT